MAHGLETGLVFAGLRLAINVNQRSHPARRSGVGCDDRLRIFGKLARKGWIGEEPMERGRKCVCVSCIYQQPGYAVGNRLRNAAERRRNGRNPGGHGLEQDIWRAFRERRQSHQVSGQKIGPSVTDVSRHDQPLGEPQGYGRPVQMRLLGTIADNDQLCIVFIMIRAKSRERLKQVDVPLFRRKPAYGKDHATVPAHTKLLPQPLDLWRRWTQERCRVDCVTHYPHLASCETETLKLPGVVGADRYYAVRAPE